MMSRPDIRVITGKETSNGRRARKDLCVEIGSLEHPYFSNSVRRQIREAGVEVFSPKLPALFLEKQFERRSSLRLSQTFNSDGTMMSEDGTGRVLSSQEIRKSMMMRGSSSGKDHTSNGGPSASSSSSSASSNQHAPTSSADNQKKDLNDHISGSQSSTDNGISSKSERSEEESEEAVDWNARARSYNPIFIRQKRKVASALLTMAKNHQVRHDVVRDGGVRALGALVRMFDVDIDADCSDALCCLADAEQTRSAMFADGAVKAILNLASRTSSNATQYSLALGLGSLACEHGYETDLIDLGTLHALLEMQKSANAVVMDEAVGRALYNFATSNNDHGRFGEVASAILSFAAAPGGGTIRSPTQKDGTEDSTPVLESNIACRDMFFRSVACAVRIRPLHNMLVNGGTIGMLKKLIDRMMFDDLVCEDPYKDSANGGEMNPVEASTIAIIILCLLSSTASIRVAMVEEGAIEIVMNIANGALERMDDRIDDGTKNSVDADIVCLAVAMLTNLALNPKTRSDIVSVGAVPVIIGLSHNGNESIARACASALRGLTSDDDIENLTRIMRDGGIQAVLRLSTSTSDVVTRRNCALAMRNILSHTETLEELLNNPNMANMLTDMYEALYGLLSLPRDVDVVRYTLLSMYNLSCTTSGASRLRLVSGNLVSRIVEIVDAWSAGEEELPMDVRSLCASFLYNVSLSQANITRILNDGTFRCLPLLMGVYEEERRASVMEMETDGNSMSVTKSESGGGSSNSAFSKDEEDSGGSGYLRTDSQIIVSCANTMFNLVGLKRHCIRAVDDKDAVKTISYLAHSHLKQAKIMAGAILCRLAQEPECIQKLVAAGLLQSLISLIHWTDQETRQRCIVAICSLADGHGMRSRLVDEGAVPALISLLSSHDMTMRRDCAAAICDLTSCEGEAFKGKIVRQGAVSALAVVALVRSADDEETQKACIKALYNLLDARNEMDRMVDEGIVGALTTIGQSDEDTLVLFAVGICNLAADSAAARCEIAKGRNLRKVIALSECNNPILNEACAKTLYNMASQDGGRYCPQVAINGGLAALGVVSEKLQCASKEAQEGKENKALVDIEEANVTIASHDFDSLFTHTVCATAYNEESCDILIEENGFATLTALLMRPSEEQLAIENKCANAILKLAQNERTRRLSVLHGAMNVLCELAGSLSNDILEKVSKCCYLYASDSTNHSILEKTAGSLLTRLTERNDVNLSLVTKRLLIRSVCLMSTSPCCRSLVEHNVVPCVLHLCFEEEYEVTLSGEKVRVPIDMLRTIDLITTLANFSFSGNTAKLVSDGACGALVSLVQQFRHTNKSQNGRIACALRNLTCYLGNAQRMAKDGVIEAILELSDDSK